MVHPPGRPWRLLDTGAAAGSMNMAIDEALMDAVRAGAPPTLRVYRWEPACLSFGRNQPARGRYDRAALRAAGVDVVRRPTGGRAVLHDDELTYSVVCSAGELGPPRLAYRRINEVLVAALAALGVPAAVQEGIRRPAPVPSTVPCFAEPVEGEVLAAGRKLVGSAQVHRDGVLLQHGSLPFRPGPASRRLETMPTLAGNGAPAYLESVLGRLPTWDDIVEALRTTWEAQVGAIVLSGLTPEERTRAETLAREYAGDDWTWRR